MAEFPKRENIHDIVKKYKEAGSCSEEFKKTLIKSSKWGVYGGSIFGIYVATRMQHRTVKGFASKVLFTTIATTAVMGSFGIIIGTYNCLRLK